jgi:hypothetical protein
MHIAKKAPTKRPKSRSSLNNNDATLIFRITIGVFTVLMTVDIATELAFSFFEQGNGPEGPRASLIPSSGVTSYT